MTNGEKYLKDGVSVEEFINELCIKKEYVFEDKEYGEITETHDYEIYITDLTKWFNEQATPTLTEDERVILRNIDKKFIKIGRNATNSLYFTFEDIMVNEAKYYANVFDNIFQFIKERRKI